MKLLLNKNNMQNNRSIKAYKKTVLKYSMNTNLFYTEITSPLDQFEIRDLLSIDAPILNNFTHIIN